MRTKPQIKLIALNALLLSQIVIGCGTKESASPTPASVTPAPSAVVSPVAVIGMDAGLKEPRGIAVDSKGRIFIADTGNQRVVSLDPKGKVRGTWSNWGGETLLADLAATPDGHVVTLDAKSGDVEVFEPGGKSVLQFPGVATNSSGLGVGPEGRIWVAATGYSRVLRLNSDGKPEAAFTGITDTAHPRFEQPLDVALAPDGTAYVADMRGRIMRLAPDGKIAAQWRMEEGRSRGGSHLAVWRGLVVMTDPDRQRLDLLDPKTGAVRFIGEEGNTPGRFRLPVGVAVGGDDNLYVVDSGNARVQVFADAGK